MKIPEGVNQLDFYHKAREKGVHLESRYPGVYLMEVGGKPHWRAQAYDGPRKVNLGTFPLDEVGERTAALKYQKHLQKQQS
jgi:hypothetical protein